MTNCKPKSRRQILMNMKIDQSLFFEIEKADSVRATLYRLSQITGNVYKTQSLKKRYKVTRIA